MRQRLFNVYRGNKKIQVLLFNDISEGPEQEIRVIAQFWQDNCESFYREIYKFPNCEAAVRFLVDFNLLSAYQFVDRVNREENDSLG